MSRHPYDLGCLCARCVKERTRRLEQSQRAAHVAKPALRPRPMAAAREASREEQHARYVDAGPQAWDDQDGGS